MTMQPRPNNPIEATKAQVRRDSRNAAICVVGGIGGGIALWILLNSFFLVLGLVVAVAGGAYYGSRVRKAIDKDPSSPY